MRKPSGATCGALACLAAVVALSSCERSQGVGWADREMPDSLVPDTVTQELAPSYDPENEYRMLANELGPVLSAAMSDEQLRERYTALAAAVDESAAEKSSFYRGLVDRREQIEARFAEAEETGVAIPDSTRTRLLYNYQNIEYELGRYRDYELQAGDFKERFWEFKLALFERMRELAPERVQEINRLQELDRQRPPDAEPPPNVGLTPIEQ